MFGTIIWVLILATIVYVMIKVNRWWKGVTGNAKAKWEEAKVDAQPKIDKELYDDCMERINRMTVGSAAFADLVGIDLATNKKLCLDTAIRIKNPALRKEILDILEAY